MITLYLDGEVKIGLALVPDAEEHGIENGDEQEGYECAEEQSSHDGDRHAAKHSIREQGYQPSTVVRDAIITGRSLL